MADKETEQIKKLNQTVHSKDTRERDQAYNEYVKQVTPTHNLIFHMVKAFFTGGIICCIGQFILNRMRKLWTGQRHLRRLVQHASDPAQRDPDGI